MKSTVVTTFGLWAIAVLLFFNLFVFLLEANTASAQKGASAIGRYQVSSWALSTGGTSHYTGYYVIDTTTGRITDKATEVHKQGEFDVPQN
ncbi:MAG: hypothetical protein JW832_09035 [Deltaproteobacteria bacterium]|nr:hypothetical protein [Deltaproteobacteria bacterium]